jgi:ligand-binding SRPBCC domain-containing protein
MEADMNDYIFETGVWLPEEPEAVFDFFKDAANLEQITPPWLNFEIHTPLPIAMKKGQHIDYRIRLYGIPMRWRTEITEWNPPFSFVDSQIRGPYAKWVHTHIFEARDGGTWMQDHVAYRIPGGWLSVVPQFLFVGNNVAEIFRFREREIRKHFSHDLIPTSKEDDLIDAG